MKLSIQLLPDSKLSSLTTSYTYTLTGLHTLYATSEYVYAYVNGFQIDSSSWSELCLKDGDRVWFAKKVRASGGPPTTAMIATRILIQLPVNSTTGQWRKIVKAYEDKWRVVRHFRVDQEHRWATTDVATQETFENYTETDASSYNKDCIFVPRIIDGKITEVFILRLED